MFTPLDSLSPEGRSEGPYQLSASALPVTPGTVSVKVDGFLVSPLYYTLDYPRGLLTFAANQVNFRGIEHIEVQWRYQPSLTQANPKVNGRGMRLGLEGALGVFSWKAERENTSRNFFSLAEGGPSGASTQNRWSVSARPGQDIALLFSHEDTARDLAETSLARETTRRDTVAVSAASRLWSFKLDHQRASTSGLSRLTEKTSTVRFSLSASARVQATVDVQQTQRAPGGVASQNNRHVLSVKYQSSGALLFTAAAGHAASQDHQPTAPVDQKGGLWRLGVAQRHERRLSFALEEGHDAATGPLRKLSATLPTTTRLEGGVTYQRGGGEPGDPTQGAALSLGQTGLRTRTGSGNLRWSPWGGAQGRYQWNLSDLQNPGGQGRATRQHQWQWTLKPGPCQEWTLLRQDRRERDPAGTTQSLTHTAQGRLALNPRTSVLLNFSEVAQAQAASRLNSRQWRTELVLPPQRLWGGLQVKLAHETSHNKTRAAMPGNLPATHQTMRGMEVAAQASPFWPNRPVQLLWRTRRQHTGLLPATHENTLKTTVELPLTRTSGLVVGHERQWQRQSVGKALSRALDLALRGNVSKALTLTGGYRGQRLRDTVGLTNTQETWSLEGDLTW